MKIPGLLKRIRDHVAVPTDDVYLVVVYMGSVNGPKEIHTFDIIGPVKDVAREENLVVEALERFKFNYNIRKITGKLEHLFVHEDVDKWLVDKDFESYDEEIEDGELKGYKVMFGQNVQVKSMPAEVQMVLDAIGIEIIMVTDGSSLGDFCLSRRQVVDLGIDLGVEVCQDDLIWEVAQRLRSTLC